MPRLTSAFQWTDDERAKGVYVAKRAIRLNRDPARDLSVYMGMTGPSANRCITVARDELRPTAVHRAARRD